MEINHLFSRLSDNKIKKTILKIAACTVIIVLLFILIIRVFIGPWAEKKIESSLNEKNINYIFEIDRVHILFFSSGIELRGISGTKKDAEAGKRKTPILIASVKVKGLNLLKAIFKKEISIREVSIFRISVASTIKMTKNSGTALVAPINITIGRILFDRTDISLKDSSSKESFSLKDGVLEIFNLKICRNDSIAAGVLKDIDFKAGELILVTPDSMYSFIAKGITCSAASGTISADTFSIHPNYGNYDFTSRYKLQKDRIEVTVSGFFAKGFDAAGCLASGNIVSSYVEMGELEVVVFRDKRKEFNSKNKPSFQELIHSYPAILHIDSIVIKSGGIIYSEHSEKANEPGSLRFEKLNAKLYTVANDLEKDARKPDLILQADALFMKEGKLSVLLEGKLNDPDNSFSLNGTLKDLEAATLNPFLEKTAFIYATSGHINYMNFSFSADNNISKGNLTLAYTGLDIALKNKHTDDTTALKEKFLSVIVNMEVINSNPMPGEKMRLGIIEYKRDPQRFLFSYCAKSIMSGIRTSLVRQSKRQ
jgi:hypothetical protein